jgi:hypothetical protein
MLRIELHEGSRDVLLSLRGYRPLELNGIPLLDEVVLDLQL